MDGAGSVIAANYMYSKAEKDGLTVGIWNSQNVFNQMMGDPSVRFDGRKFGWMGCPEHGFRRLRHHGFRRSENLR